MLAVLDGTENDIGVGSLALIGIDYYIAAAIYLSLWFASAVIPFCPKTDGVGNGFIHSWFKGFSRCSSFVEDVIICHAVEHNDCDRIGWLSVNTEGAGYNDIMPPLEIPVTKTRLGSTLLVATNVSISFLVKPTSSIFLRMA